MKLLLSLLLLLTPLLADESPKIQLIDISIFGKPITEKISILSGSSKDYDFKPISVMLDTNQHIFYGGSVFYDRDIGFRNIFNAIEKAYQIKLEPANENNFTFGRSDKLKLGIQIVEDKETFNAIRVLYMSSANLTKNERKVMLEEAADQLIEHWERK